MIKSNFYRISIEYWCDLLGVLQSYDRMKVVVDNKVSRVSKF
ncbi:hypothetical protein [Caminibacter pacificus]|nr:hypothetical protein [Caminibacter pacificus]